MTLGLVLGPSGGNAQAVVHLTGGSVADGEPTVLRRASGVIQVAFTRVTLLGGSEVERGIFFTRSADGGNTFLPAVPLVDLPGVKEESPTLLETPSGILYCYFVSDEGGTRRLWWANSVAAISAADWTVCAIPMDLGWTASTPLDNPAAVVTGPRRALLVYENTLERTLCTATLTDFIAPDTSRTSLGPGVEPSILRHPDGYYLLAYRPDPLSGEIDVGVSPDGSAWSVGVAVDWPTRLDAPHLALLPSRDVALFFGEGAAAGEGRVFRALATTPLDFGSAYQVPIEALDVRGAVASTDDPSIPEELAIYLADAADDGSGESRLGRTTTGACDLEPFFGGVASVSDPAPCLAGSLLVEWYGVLSWGRPAAGHFEVHRSTDPEFEPDGSTLLGTTVGLAWLDDTLMPDVDYTYLVRAVGGETCSMRADGTVIGLADGNRVFASGMDPTQPLAPGEVTGLRLRRAAAVSWASWDLEPTAVGYFVGSYSGPLPGAFTDLTRLPALPPHRLPADGVPITYYLVRAVNACGVEGPPGP